MKLGWLSRSPKSFAVRGMRHKAWMGCACVFLGERHTHTHTHTPPKLLNKAIHTFSGCCLNRRYVVFTLYISGICEYRKVPPASDQSWCAQSDGSLPESTQTPPFRHLMCKIGGHWISPNQKLQLTGGFP